MLIAIISETINCRAPFGTVPALHESDSSESQPVCFCLNQRVGTEPDKNLTGMLFLLLFLRQERGEGEGGRHSAKGHRLESKVAPGFHKLNLRLFKTSLIPFRMKFNTNFVNILAKV